MPDAIVNGNSNGVAFGIDHSVGLVSRLAELLEQGNGSDVTLRLETLGTDEVRVIQAHSLVLMLQSPVFEEMLRNRTAGGAGGRSGGRGDGGRSGGRGDGSGSDTLVIRETAESVAVFDKFIR